MVEEDAKKQEDLPKSYCHGRRSNHGDLRRFRVHLAGMDIERAEHALNGVEVDLTPFPVLRVKADDSVAKMK